MKSLTTQIIALYSVEVARCKQVTIIGETPLTWTEATEKQEEAPVEDDKAKRIAELEAELAVLRG